MRILVFFDLPVKTKTERKVATQFRNFLIKDGYHMLQYSYYARICNGNDAVEKHKKRLYANVPNNGSVRMLVITEKQYQSIEILAGKLTSSDEPFQAEQLTIF
ncbi:MAG: CRISPR-associated endonuclease Cas2 [Defluviitaleaceae bacterium]|nr:CRISPR-associated endonuclease Cas2 [Defluviitaleaceae bacterium]